MSSKDLRELFDSVLTESPPDTTDVEAAIRAGHLRRLRRRLAPALLATATVTAVLGLALAGLLPGMTPPDVHRPGVSTSPTAITVDSGTPVASASEVYGVWWTVELDGQDVRGIRDLRGNPLILRVQESGGGAWWSANDNCNDTSGRLAVSGGRFDAQDGPATLVGCPSGLWHPRNPKAVEQATEARLIAASGTTPRRLLLLDDTTILAVYVAVPEADPTRPGGTVLIGESAQSPSPGSGRELSGALTIGADHCAGLDGRTAVFPVGTSWAPDLGLLVLPDGTTAKPGDTLKGWGRLLATKVAQAAVKEEDKRSICPWTDPVPVFKPGSTLSVSNR